MSFLTFFRYPFEAVVRNRRRSLYAVIGIVIALSLVSGSWVAVDSSGMGLLRSRLKAIPVDFVASARANPVVGFNESMATPTISAIGTVEHVTGASVLATAAGWKYLNSTGHAVKDYWGYNFTGTLMFLPQDTSRFLDAFDINGAMPEPGSVAIPESIAKELRISVGQSITCQYEKWQGYTDEWGNYTSTITYLNLSFKVTQLWTQDKSALYQDGYYWYEEKMNDPGFVLVRDRPNPIVFNMNDIPLVEAPASGFLSGAGGWGTYVEYYIWIDRGAVIDLANLGTTLDRLDFMKRQLARVGYTNGFDVYQSDLAGPIEELIPTLEGIKPLFAALSLPVIALGTYLSLVGVDLGVNERKREIAILKSRGGSNRQVFSSLMIEAFILGTFAGIGGLVLGLFVSRFLLDIAVNFSYNTAGEGEVSDLLLTWNTVLSSVLFGVALMVISSYRPFKKASKADVKEALHYYSPTVTQIDYKPKIDIILLALSVLSIVTISVGYDWPEGRGFSWITELLVIILIIVGIAFFPLMPFLLSLSTIRLLTRGSRKLYAKLTFIVRPWTKELHYLVDKNIVRNPRRASSLCLIIALALAFGLFISVTMESTVEYERNRIVYSVGSDIKVQGSIYGGRELSKIDRTKLSGVSQLEGVDGCALYEMVSLSAELYYGGYGYGGVAIDAPAYKDTVRPDGFYFVDGGDEMLDSLASVNGSVIVAEEWADYNGVVVDDVLRMRVDWTDDSMGYYNYYMSWFDALVVGTVKGLPGFDYYTFYMDRTSFDFLKEPNRTAIATGYGAFIELETDADPHLVALEAEDVFSSAGLYPSSALLVDELEQLNEDPTYKSLSDFLYMEYVLSIAIMTVGVGLLIFVAVSDREKELACIMARGSSGRQIRKILMGESMTLMVLGLLVGGSVGIITAYLFNTLFTSGTSTVVPREMVFSMVSATMILVSIVALLLSSLLATSRAGRIKLAEVLRIRGG